MSWLGQLTVQPMRAQETGRGDLRGERNTQCSLIFPACNIIKDSGKRRRGEKLPVLISDLMSKTSWFTRIHLFLCVSLVNRERYLSAKCLHDGCNCQASCMLSLVDTCAFYDSLSAFMAWMRWCVLDHCSGGVTVRPPAFWTTSFQQFCSLFAAQYTSNILEKPVQTVSYSVWPLSWTLYGEALGRRELFTSVTSAESVSCAAEHHSLNMSVRKCKIWMDSFVLFCHFKHNSPLRFSLWSSWFCTILLTSPSKFSDPSPPFPIFPTAMSKCCTQTPVSKSAFMVKGGLKITALKLTRLEMTRVKLPALNWARSTEHNILGGRGALMNLEVPAEGGVVGSSSPFPNISENVKECEKTKW